MIKVERYLNGKPLIESDLSKVTIDCEEIWAVINSVNRRLKDFYDKQRSSLKIVEKK